MQSHLKRHFSLLLEGGTLYVDLGWHGITAYLQPFPMGDLICVSGSEGWTIGELLAFIENHTWNS